MKILPGAFGRTGALLSAARAVAELWRLPRAVRRFYAAALWTAIRKRDGGGPRSSLPPKDLARLLKLAAGRPRIVELGTANGWTALSLAVGHPKATVLTLDPRVRPSRATYVALAAPDVRSRVTFLQRGGEEEAEPIDVDLLFIDSSHEFELEVACFERWAPRVVPGGVVVFDDYEHPAFPGPAQAVRELGLEGERAGRMFVWTKPR